MLQISRLPVRSMQERRRFLFLNYNKKGTVRPKLISRFLPSKLPIHLCVYIGIKSIFPSVAFVFWCA